MEKTYAEFLEEFGTAIDPLREAIRKKDILLVVHDGVFHADDVLGCAIVREYIMTHTNMEDLKSKTISILRTRELDQLTYDDSRVTFILDLGKIDAVDVEKQAIMFDHHQDVAYRYSNDVSMAACGKIFSALYTDLKEPVKKYVIERLLYPIEAKDNGDKIEGLRDHKLNWVHELNLTGEEDKSPSEIDKNFEVCVNYAQNIFRRILVYGEAYSEALHEFAFAVSDMRNNPESKDLLIFNKGIPWMDFYFNPGNKDKAKFIIFPHIAKGWVVRAIPPAADSYEYTYPLPKEWWGKEGVELAKVSGVPGAQFCHKNGFMAKWDTKDHAIAAAKDAIHELELIGYEPPVLEGPPEWVAVDFDDTITMPGSKYVGDPNFRDFKWNMKAVRVLKKFQARGGKLILNTLRDSKGSAATLGTAVEEMEKQLGLKFDAINQNHPYFLEKYNGECSNKIAADFYIDDRSVIGRRINWNAIDAYLNPPEMEIND